MSKVEQTSPHERSAHERPWEALPEDALAAWSPHLPALVDEIIEAIRAEVPAYARPLEGAFRQAVRRDPNNWVLHRDYAIVLRRLGDRARARTRMGTALALNPRMILPPGFAAAK